MASSIDKRRFSAAYEAAPATVRYTLMSDETTQAIEHIQSTFSLHVDTAGSIAEQVGYMLLGLIDPATFYQNLLGFGLPPDTVNSIVKEINVRIFQPLQKRVREGFTPPEEADEPEAEYSEELEDVIAQSNTPTQTAAPIPAPRVEARVEVIPTPPVPVPTPDFNLVRPDALVNVEKPIPAPVPLTPVERPQVRTMQHDIEMLQNPGNTSFAPHPSQITPARSFQTASVPFTSTPTPSRPVEERPQVLRATVVEQPTSNIDRMTEASRTGDPYREPV